MLVLAASVLVAFATFSQAVPIEIDTRIVNGTDADIEELPYMISLHFNGRHTCGGSILDRYNVLTAGHCVTRELSGFTVQYGVSRLYASEANIIPVERIVLHEGYTGRMPYHNDLAVLHLASPLPLGIGVWPIRLPAQYSVTPGDAPAVLSGWGLEQTGGIIQEVLQRVDIKVYTDTDCESIHQQTGPTSRLFHVCGGVPEGGKGQCSGDSGGPLVVNGVEIGIVSWSIKPCTIRGYPGVYTKVSSYTDWIQRQLKRV